MYLICTNNLILVVVMYYYPICLGVQDENSSKSGSSLNLMSGASDPWAVCLFGFLERGCILTHCPAAIAHAWPIVYSRLHSLFTVIDPT